jgi:nucleoside-diphosphate-sugar epimerase
MFTVLGASGFVGSHLTRYLRATGHDVYTPARNDTSVFSRQLGHAVYCVGMTANYRDKPLETIEAHVGLFGRYLREAQYESLLYLSSTRLYDGCTGECGEDRDLALSPANPRHLFDLSKALGEALCHSSGRPDVRIARLSSVYSDELDTANFLHGLIGTARRSKIVPLGSPANVARDYIHIDDVNRLLEAVALRGRRLIYNVASGENVSNAQLADLVSRLTGATIQCAPANAALRFPVVRIDAIAEDFGIRPKSLEWQLGRMLGGQRPAKAVC